MEKSRLVCDACGAAIQVTGETNVMICPYCGAKYKIESAQLPEQDPLRGMIVRMMSNVGRSNFANLSLEQQDLVIAEIKDKVRQNKVIEAIQVVRIHTNAGLKEAKDIVDTIREHK